MFEKEKHNLDFAKDSKRQHELARGKTGTTAMM
jgi:hypothetical protein